MKDKTALIPEKNDPKDSLKVSERRKPEQAERMRKIILDGA